LGTRSKASSQHRKFSEYNLGGEHITGLYGKIVGCAHVGGTQAQKNLVYELRSSSSIEELLALHTIDKNTAKRSYFPLKLDSTKSEAYVVLPPMRITMRRTKPRGLVVTDVEFHWVHITTTKIVYAGPFEATTNPATLDVSCEWEEKVKKYALQILLDSSLAFHNELRDKARALRDEMEEDVDDDD